MYLYNIFYFFILLLCNTVHVALAVLHALQQRLVFSHEFQAFRVVLIVVFVVVRGGGVVDKQTVGAITHQRMDEVVVLLLVSGVFEKHFHVRIGIHHRLGNHVAEGAVVIPVEDDTGRVFARGGEHVFDGTVLFHIGLEQRIVDHLWRSVGREHQSERVFGVVWFVIRLWVNHRTKRTDLVLIVVGRGRSGVVLFVVVVQTVTVHGDGRTVLGKVDDRGRSGVVGVLLLVLVVVCSDKCVGSGHEFPWETEWILYYICEYKKISI